MSEKQHDHFSTTLIDELHRVVTQYADKKGTVFYIRELYPLARRCMMKAGVTGDASELVGLVLQREKERLLVEDDRRARANFFDLNRLMILDNDELCLQANATLAICEREDREKEREFEAVKRLYEERKAFEERLTRQLDS